MITYAVQHPDMSHALLMETTVELTPRGAAARAAVYVLRHFDEMLDLDEFVVREVPGDTPDTYSIFEEAP